MVHKITRSMVVLLVLYCTVILLPVRAETGDLLTENDKKIAALAEERAEILTVVQGMEEEITGIRNRERELHGSYRGAVEGGKDLMDPENVDEETGEIILRIIELEKELKVLREDVKARLADHPQTVKAREDLDSIHNAIKTKREERMEIQKVKIEKVARIRMIDLEMREIKKAIAEEESESKEEEVVEVTEDE